MEQGGGDQILMGETVRDRYYCVLYTGVLKQEEVSRILKRDLPDKRGTVFYPCVETWRRDEERIEVRPLFPGYIFIYSDMKAFDLHDYIRKYRYELSAILKELHWSQKRRAGEEASDFFTGETSNDEDSLRLADLSEKESEFLDFMLDISRQGRDPDREPGTEGLLKMSYGYQEKDNTFVVMEGPLKAYEKHIKKVTRRDKRAYLDIKIWNIQVKAGFEVRPKRDYFPDDKDAPAVLADGTECDVNDLKRIMNSSAKKKAGRKNKETIWLSGKNSETNG